MKETGQSEAEILAWPLERFNSYVRIMDDLYKKK